MDKEREKRIVKKAIAKKPKHIDETLQNETPPRATPEEIAAEIMENQPPLMPSIPLGIGKFRFSFGSNIIQSIVVAIIVSFIVLFLFGNVNYVAKKDFTSNLSNVSNTISQITTEYNQIITDLNNKIIDLQKQVNSLK